MKITDMPNAYLESNEAEFQNTLFSSYSEQDFALEDWSLIASEFHDDTWCSSYPSPPSLTAGSVTPTVCFDWDDTTSTRALTTPMTVSGCTDTGIILNYQVDLSASALTSDTFKLTIDGKNNLVRFTGLAGGTATGVQTITVTGTLPDNVTFLQWTFEVLPTVCFHQVFTAPTTDIDQVYYVTNPYADYQFPAFTKTQTTCAESYTNSITPTNSWITDSAGVGETVGWQTNDNLNVGFYTI